MLRETPRHIRRPADIGQVSGRSQSAEDIDVAMYASPARHRPGYQRKLLKEPAGTTGCAPESKPPLLGDGVE